MPLAAVLNQTFRLEHFLFRSVHDAVSFGESVSRSCAHPRHPSDTETLIENLSRQVAFTRSPVDTLVLAEAATKVVTLFRSISDDFNFHELVVRALAFARTASDTESVSESIQRGEGRTATDSETFSEVLARELSFARAASDIEHSSDTTSHTQTFSRSATDTETTSDSTTRGEGRSASDSVSFSDSVARSIAAERLAVDIMAAVIEFVSRHLQVSGSATDTTTLSEMLNKGEGRSASDTMSVSDLATRMLALNIHAFDVEVFQDSAGHTIAVSRSASDTAPSTTDSVQRGEGRTATDSFVIEELTSRLLTTNAFAFDNFTVFDAPNSKPLLLTNPEKQFLIGICEDAYNTNSPNYYMSSNWEDEHTILTSILDKCSTAPRAHGLNVWDRYGYHFIPLWYVDLTEKDKQWLMPVLSQWMDVNGYYGTRPLTPGYFGPTTQVAIVQSLIQKLNAFRPSLAA